MTPPANAPDDRPHFAPDDRQNRPGWHVAMRRYSPSRLWSISVGHTGRLRPPRSRRQTIIWFVVLDMLGTAVNAVALIHAAQIGQLDSLMIPLSLSAPTLVLIWMWRVNRPYMRNTRD